MKRTAANLGHEVMSISWTTPSLPTLYAAAAGAAGTSRRSYIRRMFDVRRKPDGLRVMCPYYYSV
jgi:hypothetical protein